MQERKLYNIGFSWKSIVWSVYARAFGLMFLYPNTSLTFDNNIIDDILIDETISEQ